MKKLFLLSLALFALHLGAGAQDTSIVFGSKFYISGGVARGGSGIVYQWQRNGDNIVGATNPDYTTDSTLVPGFYTYVRKSVCEQCGGRWQYSNPHTIRVICPAAVQPSLISGTGAANKTQCAGSSYDYTVSAITGYTFNWALPAGWKQTAGETSNSITVTTGDAAGKISVTPVQNGSGCLGKARDSTIAAVNMRPTLTLTSDNSTQGVWATYAIKDIVYVRTGTATGVSLTTNPGSSLSVNNNPRTVVSGTPTAGGKYTVTVTATGCPSDSASGTITRTDCGGQMIGGKCYQIKANVLYDWDGCATEFGAGFKRATDMSVTTSIACPYGGTSPNGVHMVWTGTSGYLGGTTQLIQVSSCGTYNSTNGIGLAWHHHVKVLGSGAYAGYPVSGQHTSIGTLCVRENP